MKLLIIGGTGFLSSALVEESLAAGHEVTTVTRGRKANSLPPAVRQIVSDRSDPAAFHAAVHGQKFDAVLDAICFTPEQAKQDIDCFGANVGRLVMISTDFVYSVGPHRLPITEDAPRNAPTDYGRNKAAAEDALLAASDILPATVLRPPHIVGAGGLLGTGSLQGRDPALPTRLKRGEPIILLDGGSLLIHPADRRDIARACLTALTTSQTIGKAYNISGPVAVTTRHYYEIIAEATGAPLTIVSLPSDIYLKVFPNNASFARHRAYSLEALARDAGFQPTITLEESLRETLDWLEANPPPGADAPAGTRDAELIALLTDRDSRLIDILASPTPS